MDILTLGELLIDMFPGKVGQRMGEVESFHPKPGGAPANVAVAARRLGAKTAFIGKVGDDLFGHYLKDVLAREDVSTDGLRFDAEARTTMAIIAILTLGAGTVGSLSASKDEQMARLPETLRCSISDQCSCPIRAGTA